jgi:hypothetical protein
MAATGFALDGNLRSGPERRRQLLRRSSWCVEEATSTLARNATRDKSLRQQSGIPTLTYMTTMTTSIETPQHASPLASCPSCHSVHPSLRLDALEAGASWQCVRCGQRWNAERLARVAAYETWVAERSAAPQ